MLQRIIGVLMLNAATYEEIEHDQNATMEAAIIVAVVAVLSGLINGIFGDSFITTFIFQVIMAFISWVIWSAVTFFVGTNLFDGKADLGEMLRVMGYAQAPSIIPCLGFFWTLATAFVAIRQGLDLDNSKAAMTAIISFVLVLVISMVLGSIFGVGIIGAGALSSVTG